MQREIKSDYELFSEAFRIEYQSQGNTNTRRLMRHFYEEIKAWLSTEQSKIATQRDREVEEVVNSA